MIATGVGYGVSGAFGYDLPTEIIDLTNPRLECKLDNDDGTLNKISKKEYSVGGLISNNPIICGGYKSSNYFRSCYNAKTKSMTFPMLEKRMGAGSIVLNSTTLWVVGGTPYVHPVSSTEFVTINGPSVQGPGMLVKIRSHCMVYYNQSMIFLIGGSHSQDGYYHSSANTWIVDPTNGFKVTPGPSMKMARSSPACGIIDKNGDSLITVAGGFNSNSQLYLNTTELLDPSSNQGWELGKEIIVEQNTDVDFKLRNAQKLHRIGS